VYVVIRIHVAAGTFHQRFPGVEHEKAIVWLGLAFWRAKGLALFRGVREGVPASSVRAVI
jgi:hypothetical protein